MEVAANEAVAKEAAAKANVQAETEANAAAAEKAAAKKGTLARVDDFLILQEAREKRRRERRDAAAEKRERRNFILRRLTEAKAAAECFLQKKVNEEQGEGRQDLLSSEAEAKAAKEAAGNEAAAKESAAKEAAAKANVQAETEANAAAEKAAAEKAFAKAKARERRLLMDAMIQLLLFSSRSRAAKELLLFSSRSSAARDLSWISEIHDKENPKKRHKFPGGHRERKPNCVLSLSPRRRRNSSPDSNSAKAGSPRAGYSPAGTFSEDDTTTTNSLVARQRRSLRALTPILLQRSEGFVILARARARTSAYANIRQHTRERERSQHTSESGGIRRNSSPNSNSAKAGSPRAGYSPAGTFSEDDTVTTNSLAPTHW
jgi:hypothetical protein